MRRSPFTCHFCVSQFGSQLLFMKRVKLPFGPASIILNSHINILFVLTHHSLWTVVPNYRTFYFAISHCDTINQRIQQQLQTSLGISHSKSWTHQKSLTIHTHTHTHTRLTALCLGLPEWAGTRKVKPIWILLKQETVSGSGISWAICKSAPCSRQTTTPALHYS